MRLLLSCFLTILLSVAAFGGDISGKWTGNVEIKTPEGTTETEPAWADFRLNGKEVTGTAGGGDTDEALPIHDGTFDGKKLDFQVTGNDGRVYKVSLIPSGENRLEGTVEFALQDGTQTKCKMTLNRDNKH